LEKLDTCGSANPITRARIRQIETKMLQKMRDHPRSLTIREHDGPPKRIGFSPAPTPFGVTCPKCHMGQLIELSKDGELIEKCDHCAKEFK
jgi:hypothetical protein